MCVCVCVFNDFTSVKYWRLFTWWRDFLSTRQLQTTGRHWRRVRLWWESVTSSSEVTWRTWTMFSLHTWPKRLNVSINKIVFRELDRSAVAHPVESKYIVESRIFVMLMEMEKWSTSGSESTPKIKRFWRVTRCPCLPCLVDVRYRDRELCCSHRSNDRMTDRQNERRNEQRHNSASLDGVIITVISLWGRGAVLNEAPPTVYVWDYCMHMSVLHHQIKGVWATCEGLCPRGRGSHPITAPNHDIPTLHATTPLAYSVIVSRFI